MWRQSVAESVGEDVHALHVSSCRGHGPPVPELATECSPTVPERCTARKSSPWQLRQQMSKIDIVLGMGVRFHARCLERTSGGFWRRSTLVHLPALVYPVLTRLAALRPSQGCRPSLA